MCEEFFFFFFVCVCGGGGGGGGVDFTTYKNKIRHFMQIAGWGGVLSRFYSYRADPFFKKWRQNYFLQSSTLERTRADIPCKSSSKEIICMKCQHLFSGKNKIKIFQNVSCFYSPSMLSINENSNKQGLVYFVRTTWHHFNPCHAE